VTRQILLLGSLGLEVPVEIREGARKRSGAIETTAEMVDDGQ
jgi:hypothetical protein